MILLPNYIDTALRVYGVYNNGLDSTEADSLLSNFKDELRRTFSSNLSYEKIIYETVEKGVHIVTDSQIDSNPNKKIILSHPDEIIEIGKYVEWNNGHWIIVDIDSNKKVQVRGEMYRCNNTLNWLDENNKIQSYPCVVNTISQSTSGIKEDAKMSLIDKDVSITIQQNVDTLKIYSGQRFLLNGHAFRCGETIPYLNGGILTLPMETDEKSDNDNIDLNIADYYNRTTYTIEIPQGNIQMISGNALQLNAVVKDNLGQVVNKNITWTSSDLTKATIDNNGLITSISDGNCIISASLTDNNLITTSVNLVVTSVVSDNYEIVLTPNVSSIRLTEKIDFNVRLLNNGVDTGDIFITSILGTSTALSSDYKFNVIDGNNFRLENDVNYNNIGSIVNIRMVSGIHVLDKTIELGWLD